MMVDSGGMIRRNLRGTPVLVPEFSRRTEQHEGLGGNVPPSGQSSVQGFTSGLFQKSGGGTAFGGGNSSANNPPTTANSGRLFTNPPNIMQNFTEFTHSATTGGEKSVDSILSKGKELIFKKFGLGE